ncbi:MAG: preprotein translocase subunit SecA [Candidatus Melainabacteria bacterium]|nr:preprotein translocase subunit SecA [Candidatus Melainabacteria bacterium]
MLTKLLGDPNDRKVKKLEPLVDHINHFEEELQALSDEALRAKTDQFRQELANRQRSENPERDRKLEAETLELILPEAFATVREAGRRVLGMRHFDVQMIGGMVLHNGGIAEMRTGEGKTLVATLPAYLNALTGKGVHVVTVNDYLARRDSEWMGRLYNFLGLSVGLVLSEQRGFNSFYEKKAAYAADITYGTNNEFGFDYLRDNMATSKGQLVQRPYNFAIIDEVDSILIDEARTPLIISGRLEQSAETYQTMARIAPLLQPERDYTVDEKARNIILTEEGIDRAQELLSVEDLFDPKTNLAHHLLQALKAKELFRCDTDYVVKAGEIVIVDEFTGRLMEGRRWSDGLHQAVEAKEGVRIQDETQTLASITFQNLFRLYPKLSGMTGTAMTEEAEFGKIYNLEVTSIPTNRSDVRTDHPDVIYKTEAVKFFKVIEEIVEYRDQGRPVLVGTTSIEKSEKISELLTYPKAMVQHIQDKAKRLLEYVAKKDANQPWRADLEKFLAHPEAHPVEAYEAKVKALTEQGAGEEVLEFLEGFVKTARAITAIKEGVPHHVLNAKHHEKEAWIVAQAGRYQAVTIATNMAGRGTDILLGGNPELLAKESLLVNQGMDWREAAPEVYEAILNEKKALTDSEKQKVQEAGGLHIIGTERHESRRIDNQLRGRAARQGDPGSTRFYLSLEDSLMRLFGGQKIANLMEFLDVDETMPITAALVSRAIESAQRKVEAYHFDIRKNILQYDDVLTEQRRLIYEQRRKVLAADGLRESTLHMVEREMERLVSAHLTADVAPEDRDEDTLQELLRDLHAKVPQLTERVVAETIANKPFAELVALFQQEAVTVYRKLEADLENLAAELHAEHGVMLSGLDDEEEEELEALLADGRLTETEAAERRHPLRRIERDILLSIVDSKWIDYLHNLDALREGIGLRAYGQKDPLIEYKREAFEMFQALTYDIQREAVMLLFRSRIQIQLQQALEEDDDAQAEGLLPDSFAPDTFA